MCFILDYWSKEESFLHYGRDHSDLCVCMFMLYSYFPVIIDSQGYCCTF